MRKREKSPTAATIDIATVASTPGIVISRLTSGAASATRAELGVDEPQLLGVEVQLTQQRRDGLALVGGQLLLGQPAPPLVPEQVGRRAARDQVAMQDRLDLVLQPGALADDVRAPRDLAAQRLGRLVGEPHRRQVVGGQQLRQDLRRRPCRS